MTKYIEASKAADLLQTLVDAIEVILSETPIESPWRQGIEKTLTAYRVQLREWRE